MSGAIQKGRHQDRRKEHALSTQKSDLYPDPLFSVLCKYVGSKKGFMVPLFLKNIIPKLILSIIFFFQIGFLKKTGRSSY